MGCFGFGNGHMVPLWMLHCLHGKLEKTELVGARGGGAAGLLGRHVLNFNKSPKGQHRWFHSPGGPRSLSALDTVGLSPPGGVYDSQCSRMAAAWRPTPSRVLIANLHVLLGHVASPGFLCVFSRVVCAALDTISVCGAFSRCFSLTLWLAFLLCQGLNVFKI